MKLSTYLMAGAFVAGFVIAGIGVVTSKSADNPILTHVALDGEELTVGLPGHFAALSFEGCEFTRQCRYDVSNYQGVCVMQSDSVSAPVLRTTATWAKILDIDIQSDTLKLAVSPKAYCDSLYGECNENDAVFFTSETSWPITVIVPKGYPLQNVSSHDLSVQLSQYGTDRIEVETKNRIVLYDCTIDSLICTLKGLEELKVDRSVIGFVSLRRPDDDFKLNDCDGTGVIKSLSIN